jgi:hypothetical protein
MSFKVLVIPEDPTHNGYILKPLVQAIVADAGRPRASVTVLTNPWLGGYDHARRAVSGELVDRYGFWDLWLFMPDADRASPAAMQALEAELARRDVRLLCCPAEPEVEIYASVAYRDTLPVGWTLARQHPRFKEVLFEPLLAEYGDARRAGGGRDRMLAESLKNYPLLLQLCPELRTLRDRIARLLVQA